jgi:hypothetical protein
MALYSTKGWLGEQLENLYGNLASKIWLILGAYSKKVLETV